MICLTPLQEVPFFIMSFLYFVWLQQESHSIKHGTNDDFWLVRFRLKWQKGIPCERIAADGKIIIKNEQQSVNHGRILYVYKSVAVKATVTLLHCWTVAFGQISPKPGSGPVVPFLSVSLFPSLSLTHTHSHTHTHTLCQMALSKSGLTITPPLGPTHHSHNSDLMEQQRRGGRS